MLDYREFPKLMKAETLDELDKAYESLAFLEDDFSNCGSVMGL